MNKKPKQSKIKWIVAGILILLLGILGYYQLLYKAKRMNSGIYTLAYSFTQHAHIVNAVRFSPDGNFIASGSVDSTVRIWRKENGQLQTTLKHPQGITYLDYSRDGNYIATTSYDRKARLWKLPEGKLIREFAAHESTPWSVALSPDGRTIATGSEDATLRIWDLRTGALLHTLKGHALTIWSLQFTPDSKQLVSGSYDKTLKFWNVPEGKLIRSIDAHEQAIVAIAISHDGKMVASAADDCRIKLWSIDNGKLLRTIDGSEEHVQAVAFSPDGRWLISGGRDKPVVGELLQEVFGDSKLNKGVTMRLWEVSSGKLLQTFDHHGNDATDMVFSPDGKRIALASADHTVSVWSNEQPEPVNVHRKAD
ncbi:MAG TPA: WD40 repeat domain-containing protein [Flavisolibacter sp.]|jgi:WD40 repeat protein